MSGTISTTLTATYGLAASPTTIVATGAVEVAAVDYAVTGGPGFTLINDGQIRNTVFRGVSLGAGGTLTNAASGTITAALLNAVVLGSGGSVTNSGSIGGGTAGVDLTGGGSVLNEAGGAITANSGLARAILGLYGPLTVTNAGSVTGIGGSATGIALYAGGTITNLAGGTISGYGGSARGIALSAGGVVDNMAGGVIQGTNPAIVIGGGSTTIVNAGTIIGAAVGGSSDGVISFADITRVPQAAA